MTISLIKQYRNVYHGKVSYWNIRGCWDSPKRQNAVLIHIGKSILKKVKGPTNIVEGGHHLRKIPTPTHTSNVHKIQLKLEDTKLCNILAKQQALSANSVMYTRHWTLYVPIECHGLVHSSIYCPIGYARLSYYQLDQLAECLGRKRGHITLADIIRTTILMPRMG